MMKLDSLLIILIFNAIFWSLINSVKNNKDKNELTRVGETSKDNEEAESSVNAQIQMLKPKPKITKKGTTNDKKEEKRLNQREYMRMWRQNNKEKTTEYFQEYRSNNKEKILEYFREYRENNKEKLTESGRNYYRNNKEKKREANRKYRENNKEKLKEYHQNNKEKKREANRKYRENNKEKLKEYHQNNKEKKREANQKYREKRKNKKANLQNVDPIVGNVHSDNGGGNDSQEENLSDQGEEEGDKDETETYMDEQNQTVVEEPNKIHENCTNQIDLNEKYYPFDLNEKPENEDVIKD
ncbi:unnamed protein product [Meloidogyne enterolobii]|uniref:Uncharacterized protein n=1 Tax=Meloidogyne enterolobii TaxID=390850 RepID=A0ACB0Y045_MELEN